MLDSTAHLDNPDTLKYLIEQNRHELLNFHFFLKHNFILFLCLSGT